MLKKLKKLTMIFCCICKKDNKMFQRHLKSKRPRPETGKKESVKKVKKYTTQKIKFESANNLLYMK